jgi:hypothetical protein
VHAVPTQVWSTHAVAVFQVPVALQDCTPVRPEHCVWPGAHMPWHDATPAVTRHVLLEQAAGAPQVPPEPHVCTPLPEHCVAPGAQLPVQTPATHAELTQATAGPHVPALEQVCTASDVPPSPGAHCVDPGVHTPVQAPAAHTNEHTDPLSCHAPAALQL